MVTERRMGRRSLRRRGVAIARGNARVRAGCRILAAARSKPSKGRRSLAGGQFSAHRADASCNSFVRRTTPLESLETMIGRAFFGCLVVCSVFACSSSDDPSGTPQANTGGASAAGAHAIAGASQSGGGLAGALGRAGAPSDAGSSSIAGGPSSAAGGSGGSGGNLASGGSHVGGAGGQKSTPIPVKDLPVIKEMPDPLTMKDGTKVSTPEQWKLRRQELIQILEDYEYGHMPPAPGNLKASTTTAAHRITVSSGLEADYQMLHLTFGPGEKLGFDLGLFTPVSATPTGATYPVLISLTSSTNEKSLSSASVALARGYAVATVSYQQLGADASNWKSTAFFPAYPDYDWRDISAWAWGLSRAVDYLVTEPSLDSTKIMATGVSRLAQAVLVAGAFDERIALSAPVAGGAAFRFSGKEMGGGRGQGITEIVDQNTYWFGPRLPEFRNQTPRLPSDQHWLLALTAPRLFIMCNSLSDQYGRAYAAVQTYLGAKPVYQFLGAEQNVGLNFRAGTHGMTSEDWSALLDFSDQYLMKKGGTKKFDVLPPADQTP